MKRCRRLILKMKLSEAKDGIEKSGVCRWIPSAGSFSRPSISCLSAASQTEDPWKLSEDSISFPRLVVFCLLLLLSCFFGCLFLFYFIVETRRKKINKRYEEVDGVRKEKERLTNDHPTPPSTSSSLLLSVVFFHYWLTSSLVLSASKLGRRKK